MNTCMRNLGALGLGLLAGSVIAADPNDGHLDPVWDGNGKTFAAFDLGGFGNNYDAAQSAAVAADSSLYLGGVVANELGSGLIGIAKRDALGEQDDSFSADGRTTLAVTGIEESVRIVLTSGQPAYVLAAATRRVGGADTDIIVCRLDAGTGEPVAFENANSPVEGCTTAPLTLGPQVAADLLLQPDGKFIVVGTTATPGIPNEKLAYAARFNPNGSVDNSFANAPVRNAGLFASHEVKAAALAGNGKVVIVGATRRINANFLDGLVMRLNADGTQDPVAVGNEAGFGLDGGATRSTGFHDVVLESSGTPDDSIVTVGYAETQPGVKNGLIARFLSNGGFVTLDEEAFGFEAGYSYLPGIGLELYAVAVHPCAGYITVTSGPQVDSRDIGVFAWNRAGGSPTFSFGTNGATAIDMFGGDQPDNPRDVVVSGDGIYIVGESATAAQTPNTQFVMAKLYMDSLFCNGFGLGEE